MIKCKHTRSLGNFILSPNVLRKIARAMEDTFNLRGSEEKEIMLYQVPYKEGKTLGILFKSKK